MTTDVPTPSADKPTKLLYVEASPRRDRSYSSQVAGEFLDAYREANTTHEIEHMPLFGMELP